LAGRGQESVPAPIPAGSRREPLFPRDVLDRWSDLMAGARLRPAYDETFLNWLFAEMGATTSRGELVGRLVRDGDDRVLGWYVTYLHPTRISRVMQIVARPPDVGVVLDHLFEHAQEHGTPMVAGRLDPLLVRAAWDRPLFLLRDLKDLVHTRSPEILTAIKLGQSALSPMDVEAWMGHHITDERAGPPRA